MAPKAKKAELQKAAKAAKAEALASCGQRTHRGCGVQPTDAFLRDALAHILKEKFNGWPEVLINGVLAGSPPLTLFARLTADKQSWVATGQPAMGPRYYSK
eukprot:9466038-Lingulodinium_polyedra.AAC.1